MNKPLAFSLDDFGDDVSDDDIVYEPLDDVAWVDEEELNAIEVTEDEAAVVGETAEPDTLDDDAGAPAAADLAVAAAPVATGPTPDEAPAPEPAPAGPPCMFRVVIPLSDDLRDAIAITRGDQPLDEAAPDALELIAPFRCDEVLALEDALEAWAAERLPLHVTLAEVTAEVLGAQRYLAGWALTPAGRVAAAQQALKRALGDLIEPCADVPDAFEPRIVVADRVPSGVFPHLVAEMQRAFEPQGWAIEEITLEEAAPGAPSPRWIPRLTLP